MQRRTDTLVKTKLGDSFDEIHHSSFFFFLTIQVCCRRKVSNGSQEGNLYLSEHLGTLCIHMKTTGSMNRKEQC